MGGYDDVCFEFCSILRQNLKKEQNFEVAELEFMVWRAWHRFAQRPKA